ncbi:MAG: phage holin family protein [Minisyncoccia bacterium]
MNLFIHLLVSVLAIIVSAYLVPGIVVTPIGSIVLAIVLGVINVFIKPVVKLIALPITVLTLGLFSLVINALFIILASKVVPGFFVSGFWPAFWFAIVLSLVNAFFNILKNKKND